jgi:hypothetical protein
LGYSNINASVNASVGNAWRQVYTSPRSFWGKRKPKHRSHQLMLSNAMLTKGARTPRTSIFQRRRRQARRPARPGDAFRSKRSLKNVKRFGVKTQGMAKALVTAVGSAVALSAGAIAVGDYCWRRQTRVRLVELKSYPSQALGQEVVRFDRFRSLPAPVERYFRNVLREGQPVIASVTVRQRGEYARDLGIAYSRSARRRHAGSE